MIDRNKNGGIQLQNFGSPCDPHLISRRDFGRLLIGGGVALASGGVALPAWAKAAAAQPKQGGRVRIALNSQGANETFDGARALNPGDFLRSTAIYSYLTDRKSKRRNTRQ